MDRTRCKDERGTLCLGQLDSLLGWSILRDITWNLTERTYQMKHWTVYIVFRYSLVESHCTKSCFHFTPGYGLYCARRHRNLVMLHLVEHGCLWAVQWESSPCAGVVRHHPVTSLGCVRIWALALCRYITQNQGVEVSFWDVGLVEPPDTTVNLRGFYWI